MRIIYTTEAKKQLLQIKQYISQDNPPRAISYLKQIKTKIEILGKYPYIGKINATMDIHSIREFIVFGYKVIYKINEKSITILAICKYIDFDEEGLGG